MKSLQRIATRLRARGAWLLLGTLLCTGAAVAATVDEAQMIDAAGRQRMLTQRIVKAYCQIGLQVTPAVSRAQLVGAVSRFDSQLGSLADRASTTETRAAVAQVSRLWRGFRQTARGRVSRDGALALAVRSEGLLAASQSLVQLLERNAGTPEARLINVAGRQRMLSQRLAKLYMLRAWNVDAPTSRADIDAAAEQFASALATLRAAPQNTPAIRRELEAVTLQWEWFRSAVELQGAESYALVVADASESILNSMDLITAKYAALARR
jgi:nitrate/nitrite-specific signal transduction histidine kinase